MTSAGVAQRHQISNVRRPATAQNLVHACCNLKYETIFGKLFDKFLVLHSCGCQLISDEYE